MTAPHPANGGEGLGHTPGPWGVNCSHIYAPDGEIIATVRNPGSKASDYPLVANRNLMAAAPALLEALEAIAEATSAEDDAGENYRWDDREGALDYTYAKARAAIALARSDDALAKGEEA